jgi:hypothetical protein
MFLMGAPLRSARPPRGTGASGKPERGGQWAKKTSFFFSRRQLASLFFYTFQPAPGDKAVSIERKRETDYARARDPGASIAGLDSLNIFVLDPFSRLRDGHTFFAEDRYPLVLIKRAPFWLFHTKQLDGLERDDIAGRLRKRSTTKDRKNARRAGCHRYRDLITPEADMVMAMPSRTRDIPTTLAWEADSSEGTTTSSFLSIAACRTRLGQFGAPSASAKVLLAG